MHSAIKKIIMVKSKHSILHEIILKFYSDHIRNPTVEDEFTCI